MTRTTQSYRDRKPRTTGERRTQIADDPSDRVATGEHAVSVLSVDQRYEGAQPLGEGGMGVVELVKDAQIGRRVARKSLLRSARNNRTALTQFVREARVQGQLEHPAIVPVYDLGVGVDGEPYFTMKRVRGETLREIIEALRQREPQATETYTERRLMTIFSTVCAAVAFAHERGVLHRDLKPENIMVGHYGEVYVVDWGLAKLWAPLATSIDLENDDEEEELALGTPGYMSPEQVRADPILGPESDVYALGSMLFELLSLDPLHPGDDNDAIMQATLRGVDGRPSVRAPERSVAPEFDALCVEATSVHPLERLGSARALRDEVEAFLDGQRDEEQRRKLAEAHVAAGVSALELSIREPVEGRRLAMRELGRALALDPDNRAALEQLQRVLLSEPEVLPREVELGLRRVSATQRRSSARISSIGYASLLLYLPMLMWAGVRSTGLLVAFVATGVIAGVIAGVVALRPHPGPAGPWVVLVMSNLGFALGSTLYGPLVLVPGLIAVNTAAFAIIITKSARWIAVGIGSAAIIIPLVVELSGLVSPAYVFEGGNLVIRPGMLELPQTATIAILAVGSVATMLTGAFSVGRIKDQLSQAERRLHLYTWHLGQMISADESTSMALRSIDDGA